MCLDVAAGGTADGTLVDAQGSQMLG